MLTLNTQFEIEARKLIGAEIQRLADNVASGSAVADYAEYKRHVGLIAGLNSAMDLFEDVNNILAER